MKAESVELQKGIDLLETHFPDLIGIQAPVNSLQSAVKGAKSIYLKTGRQDDIFSADVQTRTGDFSNISIRLYDYRNTKLPRFKKREQMALEQTDWNVALMCGEGLYLCYTGHESQPAHILFLNFVDTRSDIHLIPDGSLTFNAGDVKLYDIERANGVLAFRYRGYPQGNSREKHLIIPERIKPFFGS